MLPRNFRWRTNRKVIFKVYGESSIYDFCERSDGRQRLYSSIGLINSFRIRPTDIPWMNCPIRKDCWIIFYKTNKKMLRGKLILSFSFSGSFFARLFLITPLFVIWPKSRFRSIFLPVFSYPSSVHSQLIVRPSILNESQYCRCRWSAIGKTKMDSLFRECDFNHFSGRFERIRSETGRKQ